MRASELPRRRQKCSLGCPVLDAALGGGIPCGIVTELVGESGAAKTQLCLQLAVAAQRPSAQGGLQGSSLYLFTESYFPYSRLQQISKLVHAGGGNRTAAAAASADKRPKGDDPCKNVFVQGLRTAPDLLAFLERAAAILSRPTGTPVRLLVVDSVAALFRGDFDAAAAEEMKERSALFFQISAKLKKLAADHDLAVVVANQVGDRLDAVADSGGSEPLTTSGRQVVPALGLGWSHCVNMRLFLSRTLPDGRGVVRRAVRVVFAPHLPNSSCEFVVDQCGVRGEVEAVECP